MYKMFKFSFLKHNDNNFNTFCMKRDHVWHLESHYNQWTFDLFPFKTRYKKKTFGFYINKFNKTCIITKVSGPRTCLNGWVALLIWLRLCGTIGESCWICKNNILQFKMRSSCNEDSFGLQKPNMTHVFFFMLFLPFLGDWCLLLS